MSAYPAPGCRGSSLSREFQTSLTQATLQLLLGDPEAFLGQMRYIIPLMHSGCTPRPPTSWTCLVNLQQKAPGRPLDPMPRTTSTALFRHEDAGAVLRAPRKGPSRRLSPATLRRKLISGACICDPLLSVITQNT